MVGLKYLSILALWIQEISAERFEQVVRFDDYQLLSIVGSSPNLDEFLATNSADIWDQTYKETVIFVNSSVASELTSSFPSLQITVLDQNVQELIDEEAELLNADQPSIASLSSATWFEDYHRYDEAKAFLESFAWDNADYVEWIPRIGKSIEGRDIFAMKITAPNGVRNKRQIYFQGAAHAREWISPAVVQYIIVNLVERYGQDTQVTQLMDELEFVIVPIVNPDGYEYTWTNNRLWRKNRRRNSNGSYGVDLNRQYDYKWGERGASTDPSSDIYAGTGPFSEPETKATSDFFKANSNIIAGIDFHSYGQLLLRPWGVSREDAPHEAEQKEVGERMAQIIRNVSRKRYTPQKAYDLYQTSGTCRDWMYFHSVNEGGRTRRQYGMTLELRPTSRWVGFQLPAREIIPTGEEIFPAVLEYARFAKENILWD